MQAENCQLNTHARTDTNDDFPVLSLTPLFLLSNTFTIFLFFCETNNYDLGSSWLHSSRNASKGG
jgi:hypothetical protein